MAQSKIGDSGLEMVLNLLRRRKWIGLIAFIVTLSLAAPFSVFLPDIYRGTATVIVESQGDPTLSKTQPLETRLVTIQQEILSRTRLSNLITTLNLYPQWRRSMPHDAIIDRLRRDIHMDFTGTDPMRGFISTTAVKLTYVGLDPQSAAAPTVRLKPDPTNIAGGARSELVRLKPDTTDDRCRSAKEPVKKSRTKEKSRNPQRKRLAFFCVFGEFCVQRRISSQPLKPSRDARGRTSPPDLS